MNKLLKTVVGFLSRAHGFDALKALVNSSDFKVIMVFTHSLNPKSQDPKQSMRDDYPLFVNLCKENEIPLIPVGSKNQQIHVPECDYIIEISWRYLIPQEIVKKAKKACFGIHRGKLPEYAGAEPIKQALINNESEIFISAHYLAPQIDQGSTIESITHPVNFDKEKSIDENVQRLRDEITPLFSKLMIKTISKFENEQKN